MQSSRSPLSLNSFIGKSREGLAQLDDVSAVSGATLTSLAIADALALRFGGTKKNSRFPNPIDMEEIRKHFPQAVGLTPSKTHPSMLQVIGCQRFRTWSGRKNLTHADQIIGYQGPIDSLLAFDQNGALKSLEIRSSFENQPYADYPNEDTYFASFSRADRFANLRT